MNENKDRERWLFVVDDEPGYRSLLSINVRRKTDLDDKKVKDYGSGKELLDALPKLGISPHAILVFLLDGNFSRQDTDSEAGFETAKKLKEMYGVRAEILNTSKMTDTNYDREFPNKVGKENNAQVIKKVEEAYATMEQKLAEAEED